MPESTLPTTPEEKSKAAVFSDEPVKVTFSKKPVTRRSPKDEESPDPFYIVYIDGSDVGEAYPKSGGFDAEIYLTRSAQPHAFKVLHAAERFFETRNISIEYVD